MHTGFVAAISDRRKYSSVIPYRQGGTNIRGMLRGRDFIDISGCLLSRRVLRPLAQFVRHDSGKFRIALKKINGAPAVTV
jgi:hypothetical protein